MKYEETGNKLRKSFEAVQASQNDLGKVDPVKLIKVSVDLINKSSFWESDWISIADKPWWL